jgi:surface antigen
MKARPELLLLAVLCSACAAMNEPPPSPRSTSASTTPAAAAGSQEEAPAGMPQPAAPLEAHAWLEQLVGEWDVVAVADQGPDVQPMQMESTESVRSLGGLWVLAEMKNADFGAMMTLGYDPKRACYVGTWVDSMQPVLWQYTGRIEEDGRALVLEAEGPSMMDPERTTQYRDTIRIKSPDHKHLTSALKNEDGTWTEFMTADYKRRK